MKNDNGYAAFRQELMLDCGGKAEYRKGGPESQAQHEVTQQKTTGSPSQIQRGGFNKYFDLGAHNLVLSKLFCVNTNILNLILRDSSYGGRYYGTSGLIAKELMLDVESVRKRLKAMEDEGFIVRMMSDNGSRYILLNPHFFCAGGPDDEDIAKRMWAKEQAARVRRGRKGGP